jgi:predicted ABC-type ATPase
MQRAGYFVLLLFVGLTDVDLSIARVLTRVAEHGHDVPQERLRNRFPRTQRAISEAAGVVNAAIFTDNSRTQRSAFTVCRIQLGPKDIFDIRSAGKRVPPEIKGWLDVVSPRAGG